MIEAGKGLPAMSLAVVGLAHPNADKSNRKFLALLCKPGEPVELRPEPENKKDELAIAVYSERGGQLGYLTAERCVRIGQLIRQGREVRAVFQGMTEHRAWIRVAFDGEEPVLPVVSEQGGEAGEPERDFYPDEIWPDDWERL